MIYIVTNVLGKIEAFDSSLDSNAEVQANIFLQEVRNQIIEREAVRFQIAKIIQEDNNTTWMNADVDNDPDEGVYQVLDHLIGSYTECASLSEAVALNEERKQLFLQSIGLDKVTVVESLPSIIQPNSSGLQEIGG